MMKIIIYKNKADGAIRRVETCDRYLERGHSIEEIAERIAAYDDKEIDICLHDVAEQDEQIIRYCATDSTLLFASEVLHPCDEAIPSNTYCYVFQKHNGHMYPAVSIIKVRGEGVRLPEIHGENGVLPIAWCRASDLAPLLGLSQNNINKLTATAKNLAWAWYKE